MSGIGFNVNINTNNGIVEVFNETPTSGTEAAKGAEGKPTLTQVQAQALGELLKTYVETAIQLAPPGSNTQANAAALGQAALEGLKELAPGFGIAAEAIKELSVTVNFGAAVADLATTPGADPKVVAEKAGQVETQAGNLAQALQDLITNSTYPNFTETLKDLMRMAQELKQAASEVKMGAIEGKYELQMAGAQKLREAAELDASAREKNIKAEVTAAWTNLAFSAVAAGFAVAGASSSLVMGNLAQQATAQALTTGGQIMNQAGGSLATIGTAHLKKEASEDTEKADLLRAEKAELDAAATKEDGNIQIASEIEEAAKKLRDASMQALGTLVSNHAQIMRTAAEV